MNTIKGRIKEVIRPNGIGAITASEHQALLLEVVDDVNKKKQDVIEDLDAIREGAQKGATAAQNIKTINEELGKKVNSSDLATINGQRIDERGDIEIKTTTPDWNASEGEAGYIKNRTHYESVTEWSEKDFNKEDDEFITPSYLPIPDDVQYIEISVRGYANSGGKVPTRVFFAYRENDFATEYTDREEGLFYKTYMADGHLVIEELDDNGVKLNYCKLYSIKQLDESFIPDSIARTEDVNEKLTELSEEITQHTLIGKGNTSVQQVINNLLPNRKYRIHFLKPTWSVSNLTITGVAKLSIFWEVNGVKEYIKYVDLAESIAESYDFTMPSQNIALSVVIRANEGAEVPFVIEDVDYSQVFEFVQSNLGITDTSKEYFDVIDVLEYGNVQNLSAGTNMRYLDSTTRVRLKATTKIRLRKGDIVASDDANIKIYVGAFNLDGTFKPYGWASVLNVEKDCDAIIMARYEVETEIDIDAVKSSLYVQSSKQSLRDSLLKDVDVNNVESLVGFPLQGTTRVRFPQWVKGKPMPITLTYMAEVTGSGQPYITCEVGAYASTRYIVENRRVQQMRIPPMLNGMDGFFMISVPNGTTLTFKNIAFNNDYQSWKEDVGIRLNSHLGFLRYAPEQTLISFEMAALMGYNACIVNPIKTSDGVWMCYHEDKAYLSADGTNDNKIALTGSQFNAKSYAEIMQYSVIPYKSMQTYWGNHPIPTLDEFFQVCTRTKMRPMFSVHPDLNNDDWQQVRKMLIKRNLLNSLTIKVFGDESLQTAYTNMGKDVKGYVYITYLTTKDEAVQLINKLNTSFAELHGILGVEIGSESAQTEEIIGLFIEAGYPVTVGTYNPIDTSVYKRLMSYGVTEFTDDLLPCGSMLF